MGTMIVYNPKESEDNTRVETRIGKPGSQLRQLSYMLWYARQLALPKKERKSAFSK